MECRAGCAACCIVVSISSKIPGMESGKPAGIRCINLTEDNLCKIFGQKDRPEVCVSLKASQEMCGDSNRYAFAYLEKLERETAG